MTSREAFVSAMARLAQGEGATAERLAASPIVLGALAVDSGEAAREKLVRLADEVLSKSETDRGRTGNSPYAFFVNAFALAPEDIKSKRRSTLTHRRARNINRHSNLRSTKNTCIDQERYAIESIADVLGLHEYAREPAEIGVESASGFEGGRPLLTSADNRTSRAREASVHYWIVLYFNRVRLFVRRHLVFICAAVLVFNLSFAVAAYTPVNNYFNRPESASASKNSVMAMRHAEFVTLPEDERIDACVSIVRDRYLSAWNRWLKAGIKPVGRTSYIDEDQPTPNGLLNLTSAVLKVIEEEPDRDVSQNLVVCAYAPDTPSYHRAISLIAGGRFLAPRCSVMKDQAFAPPVKQESRFRTIARDPGGWIGYELAPGKERSIWRVALIRRPDVQQAISGVDANDTVSETCEPNTRYR